MLTIAEAIAAKPEWITVHRADGSVEPSPPLHVGKWSFDPNDRVLALFVLCTCEEHYSGVVVMPIADWNAYTIEPIDVTHSADELVREAEAFLASM